MKQKFIYTTAIAGLLLSSCGEGESHDTTNESDSTSVTAFEAQKNEGKTFADVQMLNYEINGFDKLNLDQQKLVYYLYEAGLAGRDIIWDQNYRYNLDIRNALENIYTIYDGDKTTTDWNNFEVYLKRVWFSNGIHHHYSMEKFLPAFSKAYFNTLLTETNTTLKPEIIDAMFNEADMKRVSLDGSGDLVLNSATNFYQEDITQKEVEDYYATIIDKSDETPVEYGLNSKLVKAEDGTITEEVWKVGGMK